MSSFSELTIDKLKDQLNEYHLMVSEILSGIDAEVTTQKNMLILNKEKYECEISNLKDEIQSLNRSVTILQIEVSKLLNNTELNR